MRYIMCKNPVYIENGQGWFIDEIWNQIFRLDLMTNTVYYIGNYGGVDFRRNSYRLVKKCGDDLYIFPLHNKRNIIVYNLKKHFSDEIGLDGISNMSPVILAIMETNDTLLVYLWKEHKIVEINKLNKQIVNCYNFRYTTLNFKHLIADGNNEHFICTDVGELMEIDSIRGIVASYRTDKDIWGAVYLKDFVWINKKSEILIYDMASQKVVENIDMTKAFSTGNDFTAAVDIRDSMHYIWYIFLHVNKLVYINKQSKRVSVLTIEEKQNNMKSSMGYCINFVYENRYLYIYSLNADKNYVIDMETGLYKDAVFNISDDDYCVLAEQKFQYGNGHIYECDEINLKDMISLRYAYGIEGESSSNGIVGRNIYDICRREA